VGSDVRPDPDPEQAWKALSLVNEWVRHAEGKIIAALAAAGVSGGLLYNLASGWSNPSLFGALIGYLTLIALVATAWACSMGLVPRRTAGPNDRGLPDIIANWRAARASRKEARTKDHTDGDTGPPDELVNLLFYSDIMKAYGTSGPRYREVLASLTSNRTSLTEHIAQQVWANASVAEHKYNWANRAIQRLLISWLLLAALAYVRVVVG